MAITLNDNIGSNSPKPLDDRYFNGLNPYSTTTEANSTIISGRRYKGLVININGVEYWYKDGILDSDLVVKESGGGVVGDYLSVSGGTLYGNLIPDNDGTRSLGDSNHTWQNIYLSGGSIYMENIPLSTNGTDLLWNGATIVSSGVSVLTTHTVYVNYNSNVNGDGSVIRPFNRMQDAFNYIQSSMFYGAILGWGVNIEIEGNGSFETVNLNIFTSEMSLNFYGSGHETKYHAPIIQPINSGCCNARLYLSFYNLRLNYNTTFYFDHRNMQSSLTLRNCTGTLDVTGGTNTLYYQSGNITISGGTLNLYNCTMTTTNLINVTDIFLYNSIIRTVNMSWDSTYNYWRRFNLRNSIIGDGRYGTTSNLIFGKHNSGSYSHLVDLHNSTIICNNLSAYTNVEINCYDNSQIKYNNLYKFGTPYIFNYGSSICNNVYGIDNLNIIANKNNPGGGNINMSGTTITNNIRPDVNGVRSMGNSAYTWNNIFTNSIEITPSAITNIVMYDVYDNTKYNLYISGGTLKINPA